VSYTQLIRRLFSVNLHGGIKLGLDNCEKLQTLLQYPDQTFSSIHVAGTNGKGSVVTKIASALQLAGYRVGLYTSPHISCFRERIRINGEMISEIDVEKILSNLFHLTSKHSIPATFFEFTTFLAFIYFSQEKVDFAVLETGLGGRLDATNIVSPILSVITSISLDHTDILGNTLEAIAKEKAGIIKPFTPVVLGPKTPHQLLKEIANQQKSPCYCISDNLCSFDQENNLIAKQALELFKQTHHLPQEALEKGLEAQQPCRFEIIQETIILDVAHNPNGLNALFRKIKDHFPHYSLRILFGLSKGKDVNGCLEILSQQGKAFHLVEAPNGRGVSTDILEENLKYFNISLSSIHSHTQIDEAIQMAKQLACANQQLLVICGSFFIMNQVRQALGIEEAIDFIDLNERNSSKKEW
jgi:dihydrofolate synthase/folylpolyglutamate synthase